MKRDYLVKYKVVPSGTTKQKIIEARNFNEVEQTLIQQHGACGFIVESVILCVNNKRT